MKNIQISMFNDGLGDLCYNGDNNLSGKFYLAWHERGAISEQFEIGVKGVPTNLLDSDGGLYFSLDGVLLLVFDSNYKIVILLSVEFSRSTAYRSINCMNRMCLERITEASQKL